MIKADWHEFVSRFGLAAPNTVYNPCPTCFTPRESLFDWSSWTPWCGSNFPLKTAADYERSCRRCEIVRDLTQAQYLAVRALLWYDKREHGNKGRCLRRDCPEANLLRHDRLEPSIYLRDICLFDEVSSFPVRVIFLVKCECWVREQEVSFIRRRAWCVCTLSRFGLVAQCILGYIARYRCNDRGPIGFSQCVRCPCDNSRPDAAAYFESTGFFAQSLVCSAALVGSRPHRSSSGASQILVINIACLQAEGGRG